MTDGVISAIGNTPLIELKRFFEAPHFRVFAKLDSLNPGGSTKDRPARTIIESAIRAGLIGPQTVVVESSSGNMGIGLSQICRYYGLRFICVIDPKTTAQNVRLLQAYGAEIELVTKPHSESGEFLQARIERVQSLLKEVKNAFWPNQYCNYDNALAHHGTMHEIFSALDGKLDYMFCATSTCGTLRGCADYIRRRSLNTKLIAVDAVGSVIFSGQKRKRLIPGHGAAIRPGLYEDYLADDCVHVSDLECVIGCRRLALREAVLAGGSSGAVLVAVDRYRNKIFENATCAVLLADRGERYLDTIYSDEWVFEHFGNVSAYWQGPASEGSWSAAVS
jgi:2,3-diaminopropionate biosynthesis protein SbnA